MKQLSSLSLLAYVASTSAQVTLGAAGAFRVLGLATVTNTGPTIIDGGSVGTGGTSITGFFPPGVVNPPGTLVTGGGTTQAFMDAQTAFDAIGALTPSTLLPQQLGGQILPPGVYSFADSALLTGILTLQGNGDPGASWYFQIPSTITVASAAVVIVNNNGAACNVWWQVGSSATIGTTAQFLGNVLATASVTMNTEATNDGILVGLNGAVTLDSNRVFASDCSGYNPPVTTTSTTTITTTSTQTSTLTATLTVTTTVPPFCPTSTIYVPVRHTVTFYEYDILRGRERSTPLSRITKTANPQPMQTRVVRVTTATTTKTMRRRSQSK